MGEKDRASLLRHLVLRYEDLARRLARLLGPAEAAEALQDTYLRIGQAEIVPAIDDPEAYLLRVARNVAIGRRRAYARQRLDDLEITRLLNIEDEAPGPAAVVDGQLRMERLAVALREIPERRRAIFLAARVEGLPHQLIADRFGVSLRTVANEIQRALDHCARAVENGAGRDRG
ncbi:RNA polymerase sigma factor [Siccirubricoccus phaeus]|uniref:RNA polymerase sigma factor n=1 Tax=Siccirubricoccus phaeus TaxID=2595053 RepID=UPI0011F18455|nr:RNA polymerase sigma factor [Siccirubricoccus phaeus]